MKTETKMNKKCHSRTIQSRKRLLEAFEGVRSVIPECFYAAQLFYMSMRHATRRHRESHAEQRKDSRLSRRDPAHLYKIIGAGRRAGMTKGGAFSIIFRRSLTVSALVIAFFSVSSSFAQQKLAQAGMDFLNVTTDPRAEAMGEAVTSLDGNSNSMFFNTAGMARITNAAEISVGQVDWIAGIKHFFASAAFAPFSGEYGVIGFNFRSVNYGDLEETIIANNAQGFLDVGTFSPTAFSAGIGYAKALSDKFSIGGNINYVTQNLGASITNINSDGSYVKTGEELNVVSFDFGMLYRTGFKSLSFGMDVRNFARELKYVQETFGLPLIFNLGISMNVLDMWNIDSKSQSLTVAVDATHPRDFPEQVNVGAEYTFMQIVSLRAGYMFNNNVYCIAGGVGVHENIGGVNLGIDYSWTPFTGGFANVQRLSFNVAY